MSRQPTPNILDAVLGTVEAELSPLTTWESGRLAHLERVIEAGLQTFYDVGEALMEIRENRLYRQTHRSFEAYTKERWGMGKSRAHQLMEAARTVAAISGPVTEGDPSTIVEVLPVNEAQVRPLAGLDEQAKREVWAEAVATAPDGKVTGRHVAETAGRRVPSADTIEGCLDTLAWEAAPHSTEDRIAHLLAPANFMYYVRGVQGRTGFPVNQNAISRHMADLIRYYRDREPLPQAVDDMDGDGRAIVDIQPGPKVSTIVDGLPGKDKRIERAQRLIDQCRAITGRAFEDEYTALVGTPSDLLVVGRVLDGIVAKLEHLQRTLDGEPEVNAWGEL